MKRVTSRIQTSSKHHKAYLLESAPLLTDKVTYLSDEIPWSKVDGRTGKLVIGWQLWNAVLNSKPRPRTVAGIVEIGTKLNLDRRSEKLTKARIMRDLRWLKTYQKAYVVFG